MASLNGSDDFKAFKQALGRKQKILSASQKNVDLDVWTKAMSPLIKEANDKKAKRFANVMKSNNKPTGSVL